MKSLFTTLLAFTAFFLTSHGQVLEPVKWAYDLNKLEEGRYEITFKASIDPGWHIYAMDIPEGGPIATSFNFDSISKADLMGTVTSKTEPVVKMDPFFNMEVGIIKKTAEFSQIFEAKGDDYYLNGYVEFMVCNDEQCLPPTEFDFEIVGKGVEKSSAATENKAASSIETQEFISENDQKQTQGEDFLTEGEAENLWGFFLAAFGFGLIAIFTPCVFPMIPMTVSFFLHSYKKKSVARFQASIYGLSIIAIYTIIGTLVSVLLGPEFANFLSTHWLPNVLFFLVFVFFAASFFGMFEITLPNWMISKTDKQADKGGILGSFFMAFTLVLVSFSCTGPLVGSILVEAARGAFIRPVIGMFGFSLAFALPFTFFALFPNLLNSMPKSGGWLNSVKVVLGFLELALGLKFLSVADQTYHWGILDREIYLALWIVIFSLMGFYLLGKIKFSHDSDVNFLSVPRLILIVLTFSFVVYLVPGMFGAPLKALAGYLPPQATHDFDLNRIIRQNAEMVMVTGDDDDKEICEESKYSDFLHLPHGLEGYFDYEQGLACAKELNKPVFIDFTGHGCVNCREMEARVWSDPRVLRLLKEEYLIIALYVDDKTKLREDEWVVSDYDGKIKKTLGKKYADFQISRFNRNSQPYYVLLDTNGELLSKPMAYNLDVSEFVQFLENGLENFHQK